MQQVDFNPRSREGSDPLSDFFLSERSNFNPRSREGSDDVLFRGLHKATPISIHAPAKGATIQCLVIIACFRLISIHAPAKGATGSDQGI